MAYSILLDPPAERQLCSFSPAIQKRLVTRMKTLQSDPRPPGVKKLAGKDDLYRIREGDYRIIYTIQHLGEFIAKSLKSSLSVTEAKTTFITPHLLRSSPATVSCEKSQPA